MRKIKNIFVIFVTTVVIVLIFALILNKNALLNEKNKFHLMHTVFFVALKSNSPELIKYETNRIKKLGGAGVKYTKNDTMFVILSAYQTEDAAERVVRKNSSINLEVLKVELDTKSNFSATRKQLNSIYEYNKACINLVDKLIEYSYSNNTINEEQIKNDICIFVNDLIQQNYKLTSYETPENYLVLVEEQNDLLTKFYQSVYSKNINQQYVWQITVEFILIIEGFWI